MYKIFVIDVVDLFNDMLALYMPNEKFVQVDGKFFVYADKLPKYTDVLQKVAKFVDLQHEFIIISFLLPVNTPVIATTPACFKLYKLLVKAIKHICKSAYIQTTVEIAEYHTNGEKQRILADHMAIVGRENIKLFKHVSELVTL